MNMLKKLVNLGVNGETHEDQTIKLINVIAIAGFFITFAYVAGFGVLQFLFGETYYKTSLLEIIGCAFFSVVFTFTARRKRIYAAITLTLIGLLEAFIYPVFFFGHASGVHFFTIAFPPLCLLMFNNRSDYKYFVFFALVCTVCFLYSEFLLKEAYFPVFPKTFEITYLHLVNAVGTIGLVSVSVFVFAYDLNDARDKIALEHERANTLLLNILPGSVAEKLKEKKENIAEGYSEASIMFADIVGFTELAARYKPEEVVGLLNLYFTKFDEIMDDYGIEKIKTIGDAYMAAAGIPDPCDDHAEKLVNFAMEIMKQTHDISQINGVDIELRIGINSGPVTAGVIGTKKFIYDLWGDAVNIASRMESHGLPGKIQVTSRTYDILKHQYDFHSRGPIFVKGKGELDVYLLEGKKVLI